MAESSSPQGGSLKSARSPEVSDSGSEGAASPALGDAAQAELREAGEEAMAERVSKRLSRRRSVLAMQEHARDGQEAAEERASKREERRAAAQRLREGHEAAAERASKREGRRHAAQRAREGREAAEERAQKRALRRQAAAEARRRSIGSAPPPQGTAGPAAPPPKQAPAPAAGGRHTPRGARSPGSGRQQQPKQPAAAARPAEQQQKQQQQQQPARPSAARRPAAGGNAGKAPRPHSRAADEPRPAPAAAPAPTAPQRTQRPPAERRSTSAAARTATQRSHSSGKTPAPANGAPPGPAGRDQGRNAGKDPPQPRAAPAPQRHSNSPAPSRGSGGRPVVIRGGTAITPRPAGPASPGPAGPEKRSASPLQYAVSTAVIRKRYPRPTREAVCGQQWATGEPGCVGKVQGGVRCMVAADTTVWCAQLDGELAIREVDGAVFGAVERPKGAPAVTALLYAPGGLGSGRMLAGHADGTLECFDASSGKRCQGSQSRRIHNGAVQSLRPGLEAGGVVSVVLSCGEDGEIVKVDPQAPEVLGQWQAHSGGCAAAASDGMRCYSGGADGRVRKWLLSSGAEEGCHSLGGPVSDLLLTGRHLWCARATAVEGRPSLVVLDATSFATGHVLPPEPAAAPVTRLLGTGPHVWACQGDGRVTVWDAQLAAPVRSFATECGPVGSALLVTTVPRDFEVWTAGQGDGELRMWRNKEFQTPIWCSKAMADAAGEAQSAQRQVADMQRELAQQKELTAKEKERVQQVQQELGQQRHLTESLQALHRDSARSMDEERDRRKRLELEVAELRHVIICAHKATSPPGEHQVHYNTQDLKRVVTNLVRRAAAAGSPAPADRRLSAHAAPPSPRQQGDQAAIGALRAQVLGLTAELQDRDRELRETRAAAAALSQRVQQQQQQQARAPSPPDSSAAEMEAERLRADVAALQAELAVQRDEADALRGDLVQMRHTCEGYGRSAERAEREASEAREQAAKLQSEREDLKALFEKIKASHEQVNRALQSSVDREAEKDRRIQELEAQQRGRRESDAPMHFNPQQTWAGSGLGDR